MLTVPWAIAMTASMDPTRNTTLADGTTSSHVHPQYLQMLTSCNSLVVLCFPRMCLYVYIYMYILYMYIYIRVVCIYRYVYLLGGRSRSSEGETGVWQQEGCRFDPRAPPPSQVWRCPWARHHLILTAPDVLVVSLHGWHHRLCMNEWVNVRQYCKAIWIKAIYICNPFIIYMYVSIYICMCVYIYMQYSGRSYWCHTVLGKLLKICN